MRIAGIRNADTDSLERAAVEKVVVAGRFEAGEADGERDLRPMPYLVNEDVEQQLTRCHRPLAVAHLERSNLIRDFLVEALDELLEFPPDGCAVVKKGRRVLSRQPRAVAERLIPQPLEMATFYQKDVIDQLADGRQVP